MVAMAEAYQNVKLTPEGIKIYASALNDLSLAEVRNGFSQAVRECKFWPTVAEIRAYVTPSADDAALVAWSGLQQAAREVGSYGSLDVEDGCAATALLTVFNSWPQFCQTEEGPELGAKKAEFLAAYRQAKRGAQAPVTRLLGLCALDGGYGGAETWIGRLPVSGKVRTERAALPSGDRKALTEGLEDV